MCVMGEERGAVDKVPKVGAILWQLEILHMCQGLAFAYIAFLEWKALLVGA